MVRMFFGILSIFGCLSCPALAQTSGEGGPGSDTQLQALLEAPVRGFHGDVGIYVRHLKSGLSASILADELFPTASLIKVPILVSVFDQLERQKLDWHTRLIYRRSMLYPGEDILGRFKEGSRIDLSKLILLMITTSDNTAALWLQALVGGGAAINQWLEQNGFPQTRVNSRTPGRAAEREKYGWGQTTPREMAELLVKIREGRLVSRAASEEMYRILTRSYWNGEALSQLPPEIQAASKQGSVSRSRSEAVLVNAPSGDYVFCVITKNQRDERDKPDNEGFALLRKVSALLWKHFEPEHPWTPDPAAQRFKP
jgi:beta-lactamase class A